MSKFRGCTDIASSWSAVSCIGVCEPDDPHGASTVDATFMVLLVDAGVDLVDDRQDDDRLPGVRGASPLRFLSLEAGANVSSETAGLLLPGDAATNRLRGLALDPVAESSRRWRDGLDALEGVLAPEMLCNRAPVLWFCRLVELARCSFRLEGVVAGSELARICPADLSSGGA